MFFRLFLIATVLPLQSCSNTLIGEKLENSFDLNEKPVTSAKITNESKKTNEKKEIKLIRKVGMKANQNDFGDTSKENSTSNNDTFNQKSTKSTKKLIYNPQPYRIILRLSGANPSAPAETVTNALRKAGVKFEVEKIERFDKESLSKASSMKR